MLESTFMPRGKGPLVSVLLPSRHRSVDMIHSIDSLWSLAFDKESVEFCIKVDDDDIDSIEKVKLLQRHNGLNVKAIVSPRGRGYADMHLWINDLCRLSTGDWLLLWNDDVSMKTNHWDVALAQLVFETPCFGMWDVCSFRPKASKQFMFLRRKVVEILGHWSLSPYNDTWINEVMSFLHLDYEISVEVDHLERRRDDDVREEVTNHFVLQEKTISSLYARKRMLYDSLSLLEYLSESYYHANWESEPKVPGWYYWEAFLGRGRGVSTLVDGTGRMFILKQNVECGKSIPIIESLVPIQVENGRFLLINAFN